MCFICEISCNLFYSPDQPNIGLMFNELPITLFMTTHEKHTYNVQNATL